MEDEEAITCEDIQRGENSDNDEGGSQFRICYVPFGSPETEPNEKKRMKRSYGWISVTNNGQKKIDLLFFLFRLVCQSFPRKRLHIIDWNEHSS